MDEVKTLSEKLFMNPKNAAAILDENEIKVADDYAEGYKDFLYKCKTERESVVFAQRVAKENGFVEFDKTKTYNPGDKIYFVNRGKSIILCVIGKKSVAQGVKIVAAHIDSPRIDLKQNPLYEDSDIALFKTHYYGGIKKYQWTARPLSLHGVVMLKGGKKVEVNIGEDKDDPRFVITDLLPHLAKQQMKRTLSEAVLGEELNIVVGSRPFKADEGSELVKLNIMNILNQKYGMTQEDFLSAELEAVPAGEVSDIGFDRSLVGGYGHDDRVCAYPALTSIVECDNPESTIITVLTDKEETGSDGNTGLNSSYMAYFIADLARMENLQMHDVLSKSECLSADVNAAFDPTFPSVYEKNNASFINRGVVMTKYTGSGGKGGTSDASAEFVSKMRTLFDENDVIWQAGELGRVDEGGGGTVAKYIANLDIDVVDVGVPVLSMHAPYEVISKIDLYMAHKAFKAFFKS